MAEFDDFPIDTDPDELLQQCIDELRTYWPNWQPNETSLAYRGMVTLCRMIAEGRDVAAVVPEEIFRTVGASLFNIAAIESAPARALTTWVMIDDAGYGPIPEGTLVSVEGALFETTVDITIASGDTTLTGVPIVAIEEGAASSGLGTGGSTVDVEEAIGFVATVTLEGATALGVDAEDNTVYVERLKEILQLYTDTPIHADDLSKRARLKFPSVYRATAVDMYDADTDTPNSDGHASVALQGADGLPVATDVADAVELDLTGTQKRFLNAIIHIISAVYCYVDINWTGTSVANAEPSEVEDSGNAGLTAYLQPYAWGPTPGEQKGWTNKTTLKINDVIAVLWNSALGLASVDTVEIKIRDDDAVTVLRAFDDTDADLPGVVSLTLPGVIAGVVTAP